MNNTARQHRLKIAKQTLRLTDFAAKLLGGMTKDEARQIVEEEKALKKNCNVAKTMSTTRKPMKGSK